MLTLSPVSLQVKAAAPNHPPDGVSDDRSIIADGMTNLAISDSPGSTTSPADEAKAVFTFGTVRDIDDHFSFSLESPLRWPGPEYDKKSLWAPGVFDKARLSRPKAKQKSSKRKLSSEAGQLKLRSKELTSPKPVQEREKSPRPPEYYGSPPARDPPLHFLTLPAEIRNMIYGLLCVKSDPIAAQFRPIIKPKRGTGSKAKSFETIKRFPREPALAMVCRQAMNEILSVFYRENTFVFQRRDDEHFRDLIMTHSRMMEKWTPHYGLSASLSRIKVHFLVHTRPSGKETMTYTFRRLEGTPLQVSSNEPTVAVDSCTCFDRKFLGTLEQKLALKQTGV